jgi:dTDP-4-amino-4,6-dideoxygalactose transaminase
MPAAIPLVDLKAQYAQIGPAIDAAIRRVVESAEFIMGPDVGAFEAAYASFCGAQACVGVSSGTSALELALRAFGVGPGDEVITVAHTFIATAEAISAVGARPVFVDIDPNTYTLDPQEIAHAVTERTRAVIPVHIYGQPADMDRINAAAKAYGLVVIEDAAQAHGATWHGRRAGVLADAACFSFYPGKNLGAYGDAGAVVTDRDDIAAHVSSLRNHGRRSKYLHDQVGFGDRLDTLQAAILRAKLPYLEQWIERRKALAKRYSALLSENEVTLPVQREAADSAWHLYIIRTGVRDALLRHLNAEGIGAGVHYPVPLHLQPAYAHLGYKCGDLPVTEAVADSCLSLPLYPEMTHEQQDRVVSVISAFLEKAN